MRDGGSMNVSFGIFTPEDGRGMDDAIAPVTEVAAVIEKNNDCINLTILKCLHSSWVAVFTVQRVAEGESAIINLPQASAFTRGLRCPVRLVESGWFHQTSQQTKKDILFAEISLGNIVSVRTINCSSWKKQDTFSYYCLTIFRAYFDRYKGIDLCSFYDSMDGKQIIGLAVWNSFESARFVAKHPESNPAIPCWEQLAGGRELKYHIYKVFYVTRRDSEQDSSLSSFQI